MFEGVGVVESLKRSWQLTRGYKWMVFFVQLLVSFILQVILYLVAIVGVIVLALIGLAVGEGTAANELLMTVGIIAVFMLAFLFYMAFFASMTYAIYAECVALQNEWAERLSRPLERPEWLKDEATPPPA